MMKDEYSEKIAERRMFDSVKSWAAILGPILGIAFGVGIYKASTQGKLDEIPRLDARISAEETRIIALEKDSSDVKSDTAVATARFTEQISAINNRMSRMEDLLEKTFYAVNEKDAKRR